MAFPGERHEVLLNLSQEMQRRFQGSGRTAYVAESAGAVGSSLLLNVMNWDSQQMTSERNDNRTIRSGKV
jgi:hypothetical protein